MPDVQQTLYAKISIRLVIGHPHLLPTSPIDELSWPKEKSSHAIEYSSLSSYGEMDLSRFDCVYVLATGMSGPEEFFQGWIAVLYYWHLL
jgi:hypothetical protein